MNGPLLLIQDAELTAWLRQQGISPSPSSPLTALSEVSASASAPLLTEAQADAVRQVAQAEIELSLRLDSPLQSVRYCFFARASTEPELIGHFRTPEGQHQFSRQDGAAFRQPLRERLLLEEPLPGRSWSLELSVRDLAVLVGSIDEWREQVLVSLLERKPQVGCLLLAEQVATTLQRGIEANDPRWLSCALSRLAPFPLPVDVQDCADGLAALADQGLLEPAATRWSITPAMERLCSQLNVPLAGCSLLVDERLPGHEAKRYGLLGIRGLSRFVLLECGDLTTEAPRLQLRDSSWPDLELTLERWFKQWIAAAPRPSTPPPLPVVTTSSASQPRFCGHCGTPLLEGARFCTGCGQRLGHSNSAEER
jgi:hypothetical protein